MLLVKIDTDIFQSIDLIDKTYTNLKIKKCRPLLNSKIRKKKIMHKNNFNLSP